MKISKDELIAVLSQFNPWWKGESIADLPSWHRAAFRELFQWVHAPRAILLSGARQVGKTTLILQVIEKLLKEGVSPSNILYATFDHPIIKMAGADAIIEAWKQRETQVEGQQEYLFLDEAQFIPDWGVWIKHQVDFVKNRRIVFTGSATPLLHKHQESGVGRWHTIKLTTLSFYEYLQLKESSQHKFEISLRNFFSKGLGKLPPAHITFENHQTSFDDLINLSKMSLPPLPKINSLSDLFDWSPYEFKKISEMASPYTAYFHQYLIRGGFPQTALIENITQAQRLLREDIVDKVLKRDMTALFGVRLILELEQTFLYLCMHDGGILDMPDLCANLSVKRPTAQHFIELLEAANLIYRLQPFGYGKDILRGKFKIYLADAAIAPAVLLKGKAILDDPSALGVASETAVFKHLYAHYPENFRFTYWQNEKKHEVDLVAEDGINIIPYEIKYRSQHAGARELKGLIDLCKKKSIKQAYVITKSLSDFGPLEGIDLPNTQIMRIPAPLLCFWIGRAELQNSSTEENNNVHK